MKRVVWLTDIHLNFVREPQMCEFLDAVRTAESDGVLLSGDIGEAGDVEEYLTRLVDELQIPIYFVLGNHDYYFGSIREVRRSIDRLCAERPNLHFLTHSEPIALSDSIGLIGHDGWADGREGDYERSYIMMNDYQLIQELAGVGKRERLSLLHALGDEAAAAIRGRLPEALDRFEQVMLVTHVPPLRDACWHDGKTSDDEWAPHFVCRAMGDAILDVMRTRPDRRLTVLCGHTHGSGECRPLENVVILTGGAEYGRPKMTRVFEL